MFFPERGDSTLGPVEVCRGCTVRRECFLDAFDDPYRVGVFGGTFEVQRRHIRRAISLGLLTLDEAADGVASDDLSVIRIRVGRGVDATQEAS